MVKSWVSCAVGVVVTGVALLPPAAFAGGAPSRQASRKDCLDLELVRARSICERNKKDQLKKDPTFSVNDCQRMLYQKAVNDPLKCQ